MRARVLASSNRLYHKAILTALLILQCLALTPPLEEALAQVPALRNHAVCLDVDPATEAPINITDRFYTIDRQAVCWFEAEFKEVGPAQISWHWKGPTGSLYRNSTTAQTFTIPAVRRFWDALPIRGFLENKSGRWTVSTYFRAQLLFTETFTVDPSKYEIAISVEGLDRDHMTRLAIDGVERGSLRIGETWQYPLDASTTHNVSVASTIQIANGTRYLCRSNSRIVSSTGRIVFEYELQFYLAVRSKYGEIEPDVNGWYRNGTIVAFKASTAITGFPGVQYVFKSWSGDFVGDRPDALLVMNRPRQIEAVWDTDYSILFVMILAIAGASVIVLIMAIRKRREPRRIRFAP